MTRINHDRMRDAVLYVLISSVVIIILVAAALNRVSEYTTLKWFAFSMFTGVIFGLFISHSRPLWRKRQLWAFVGSLMSLHTVGFLLLTRRGAQIKPIHWAAATFVELVLLMVLRSAVFGTVHQVCAPVQN
jgi:hypothetical protein